jgi:hypothetical protein
VARRETESLPLHSLPARRVVSPTAPLTPHSPATPPGEALLRAGLLYLPDLDLYLAKALAGPRYQLAAEFALHLVQQCCVVEPVVGAPDLGYTLDLLSKLATRVSGGNAVLQLVEEARRVSL